MSNAVVRFGWKGVLSVVVLGASVVGCQPTEHSSGAGANSAPGGNPGPGPNGPGPGPGPGTSPGPGPGPATPNGPKDPVVGGYTGPGEGDPAAMQAAQAVLDAIRAKAGDPGLTITRVLSSQTQVVAGKNYKMDLEVSTATGPKKIRVVVYRDLQQHHSLTEYQAL